MKGVKIIKAILLWMAISYTIFYICVLDELSTQLMIVGAIPCFLLIFLCVKFITFGEYFALSGNKYLYKLWIKWIR